MVRFSTHLACDPGNDRELLAPPLERERDASERASERARERERQRERERERKRERERERERESEREREREVEGEGREGGREGETERNIRWVIPIHDSTSPNAFKTSSSYSKVREGLALL